MEQFGKLEPVILILSLTEVEQAEQFYLQLHKQYPKVATYPHQIILLCTNKQSKMAYQLCEKGIFDDYMVNRPLFDPDRVHLAINHAFKRLHTGYKLDLLHGKLEKIDQQQYQERIQVKQKQLELLDHIKLLKQGLSEISNKLRSGLLRLENALCTSADDSETAVHDHVKRYRMDYLETGHAITQRRMDEFATLLKAEASHTDISLVIERGRKILLVDDDRFFRKQTADILEEEGFIVEQVTNGMSAMNSLHQSRPDLILLDYKMPGMDGLSTLKQIHLSPELHKIPVIMLTGYSTAALVKQSLRFGAAAYVVKPTDREMLVEKIQSVLRMVD